MKEPSSGDTFFQVCEMPAGKVILRLLCDKDLEIYRTFFHSLDQETIRCRFGYMISEMPVERALRLVAVDPVKDPALAVFDLEQKGIQAIGRYYLDEKEQSAEIAIVVHRNWRRGGLGRLLLKALMEWARSHGVRKLQAYVATSNAPVLDLLESEGFAIEEMTPEEGLKMSVRLPPAGQ